MAQILIIKNETAVDGLQYLGDIVGVYRDSHVFSDHELLIFNVLTISGSVADVQAKIHEITPREEEAFLWVADNEYHWIKESELAPGDEIRVFQVSNRWYELVDDFRFPISISGLTPEEKQLLETVDINHPSVDSFIRKIVKDLAVLAGNGNEIKDLRNTEP